MVREGQRYVLWSQADLRFLFGIALGSGSQKLQHRCAMVAGLMPHLLSSKKPFLATKLTGP